MLSRKIQNQDYQRCLLLRLESRAWKMVSRAVEEFLTATVDMLGEINLYRRRWLRNSGA